MSAPPAVYHITAWKAGSTWVQGVLSDLAPDRVLIPPPAVSNGNDFVEVEPGRIYTPLYMHRPRFNESPFVDAPHRKFVIIRDLRDTLISHYFSLVKTHTENPAIRDHRAELLDKPQEDGLVYLLTHRDFQGLTMVASTWAKTPDALIITFESLIEDPPHWFRTIVDYCGIEAPADRLAAILEHRSFKNLAGRPRCTEGTSHYRRGVAGDWKNHFTPKVAREFARHYEHILRECGYEPTLQAPLSKA